MSDNARKKQADDVAPDAEATPVAKGSSPTAAKSETIAGPEASATTAAELCDDRRKFPRQPTDFTITFTVENPNRRCPNKESTGAVKNISNAGMHFVSTCKLWSGARIAFSICKKNGHPVCTGIAVVVHAEPGQSEHKAHAKFMSIEMTKPA